MPAKITTYEGFYKSFIKSKYLNRTELTEIEITQLREYYNSFYVVKNERMGKSPIRYIYNFINYDVGSSTWVSDIEQIIFLGNKANKEKMILMYGNIHGSEKWNMYIESQRESNTFEYKNKKYGMSRTEFDEYNKSRAVTLQNMIKKHGEEKGLSVYENYCEKQRKTTELNYFTDTYGIEVGTEKYNNFHQSRINNLCVSYTISKLEIEITKLISQKYETIVQYIIPTEQTSYHHPYDIFMPELNLIVEVNGDFWHMNPKKYNSDYKNPVTNLTAKMKWHLDSLKMSYASKKGYNIIVIWESDWYNNKESQLDRVFNYKE